MLFNLFCVGMGGFIGAILRVSLGIVISRATLTSSFPVATLCVNMAGSFLIGVLLTMPYVLSSGNLKGFLTAGLLGGLTTFSTFSFDTLSLIEQRMFISAFINVVANVGISLLLCYIGTVFSKLVF
ncbi:MAG: fluoride efflux transporter CrcB [Succinivibrio sp.]